MKNISIWNSILETVSKTLNNGDINKWLKPLELTEIRGDTVTLSAPNKFFKEWVEDNYTDILKKALSENCLNAEHIVITVRNTVHTPKPTIEPIYTPDEPREDLFGMPLDKSMTFSSFVSGTSNTFAYSACMAAAKGFNDLYNPLYIYGDVGLGKTHLMQAVGNELKEKFPKLKIIYTTGEAYLNEVVQALRQNRSEDVKAKYNNADVLLFDDVQVLSGREKTAEEFFFTFNLLHAKKKRIILTSNAAPNEIPNLEKRLSTRFSQGLMVDIQPPSVEEREAIIFKRFEMFGAKARPDAVRFLAENIKTRSTRDIIGVITTLYTKATFEQQEITVEYATSVVKKYLAKRDKVVSPDDILAITSEYFQLKPVDLKSSARTNSISYPRNIAMYMLRQKTSLSLNEIGAYFNRDHSTVLAAIKKISTLIENDEELKGIVSHLSDSMKMDK